MITFEGNGRNGYTAIYTSKLLLELITHVCLIGRKKPFEECCLFGSLVRGGRELQEALCKRDCKSFSSVLVVAIQTK